jgi:peptide/nickel transport system substrate-binding protein
MSSPRWLILLIWTATLPCFTLAGCGGSSSSKPGPTTTENGKAADGGSSQDSGEASSDEPTVLLEPYDPPTLDELNAKVEWEDRPVLDAMEMLREKQAGEQPLVSVEEALKLRNTSSENNAKILSALGRLPESDDQVDHDATIVRHLSGDLKSTNPIMTSAAVESDYHGVTGISLLSFDWNMQAFGAAEVIESWQTSKDRMYDKVVLRKDLTWSDGKPLTAHDVVFSFQTIMNPKVPVPAVRSGTDELRWVEAYDDYTLVFFHKEALAVNSWNILFPIIPKHIYENSVAEDPTMQNSEYHVKFEEQPVVSGPYRVVSRRRGQEVVVERRDEWSTFNGQEVRRKPHFKRIRFLVIEDPNTSLLALKKGDIHETLITADQWTQQTNDDDFYARNTKATGLEWTEFHICWNTKSPFFSDKNVRWAMGYAFDHDEMLEKIFYGLYEPAVGVFHPDAWMAPKTPPKPLKQDLDKAEELLDKAGWEDSDGDGTRDKEINGELVPFEFSIIYAQGSTNAEKVCNLLRENLDQIGIICNPRPLEWTVLQEMTQNHKFHAVMGGWGTGTDPYTLENIFKTGAERNYGEYSNKKVDELFAQGMKEFDQEKRADIYRQIFMQLYEDQAYTWLFHRSSFYGFNKSLRGYVFSPRGPFSYSPGFESIWMVKP